jgi:hypothetical protein
LNTQVHDVLLMSLNNAKVMALALFKEVAPIGLGVLVTIGVAYFMISKFLKLSGLQKHFADIEEEAEAEKLWEEEEHELAVQGRLREIEKEHGY